MAMHVQGTTHSAVSHAVVNYEGYTGRKKRAAESITPNVLEWWQHEEVPVYASQRDREKECTRYVRANVSRPPWYRDPVGFAIWPMIVSAIVQLVLKWLMSRHSREWRQAQR